MLTNGEATAAGGNDTLEGDSLNNSLTAMDWLPKMNVKEAGPDTDVDMGPQVRCLQLLTTTAAIHGELKLFKNL